MLAIGVMPDRRPGRHADRKKCAKLRMMAKCHIIFPVCGCKPPVQDVLPQHAMTQNLGPAMAAARDRRHESLVPVPPDPELLERLAALKRTRDRIQRRKTRENFSLFFKAAWAANKPGIELQWGPHIQALCDHIQWQLEDRARAKEDPNFTLRAQDIVINVPPRSLKTTILTYATVWAWIRWPGLRIMYLSANPRVALNSAREARDLIHSTWFQRVHQAPWVDATRMAGEDEYDWNVRQAKDIKAKAEYEQYLWTIRSDQNAFSDLGNTKGGARIARGLDSTITGEGAEWIIIDDPHDLRDSIEQIEKVIEGYDSAVHNRINDPRAAIRTCIMQRVNVADFTAHVLKKDWMHVCIPMEYEMKRACTCTSCRKTVNVYGWRDWRTQEGQTVHPRFTQEFLVKEKARLGSFGYATQMQQRPAVAGGGRIKKEYWGFCRISGHHAGDHERPPGCNETSKPLVIERHRHGPNKGKLDLDWLVLTVDAANKKTDRGSNYGLLAVGGKDMRRFVLDDQTRRGEFTEILEVLRGMIVRWRPDKLVVEAKAAGPSLMSSLDDEMTRGMLRAHDREDDGRESTCRGRVVQNRDSLEWSCLECQEKVKGVPIVCPIEPIEVDIDKERRVDAVLSQYEARLIYILEGAVWCGEFVEEHALFPESPWNDRVDALSQVLEAYKDGDFYQL